MRSKEEKKYYSEWQKKNKERLLRGGLDQKAQCSICKKVLPLLMFYLILGTSQCKKCRAIRSKEWRLENIDKVKKYKLRVRREAKNRVLVIP